MKKLLSSLLIGAFVLGVGAVDVQIASAASYPPPPPLSDNNKISQRKNEQHNHKTHQHNNKTHQHNNKTPQPPSFSVGNKFTQIPPPPPPLNRIPQNKMPQPPPR